MEIFSQVQLYLVPDVVSPLTSGTGQVRARQGYTIKSKWPDTFQPKLTQVTRFLSSLGFLQIFLSKEYYSKHKNNYKVD